MKIVMFTFLLNRKAINTFCGTYIATRLYNSYNIYGGKEYALVEISFDEVHLKLKSDLHVIFGNEDKSVRKEEYKILEKDLFIRYDGALVNEGSSEGFWGGRQKNAQVFRHVEGGLIREVYKNYSFKSPLGGYWFSETSDFHMYKKQ